MTNDPYVGLEYLAWALFLTVFASVAVRAVRLPTRPHTDMVLFWGAIGWLTVASAALVTFGLQAPAWLAKVDALLALALPYLLLRLVADFSDVPRLLEHGVELIIGMLGLAVVVFPPDLPTSVQIPAIVVFVAIMVYDTVAFQRAALTATGVTRRRFVAIALGSMFLSMTIMAAGLSTTVPALAGIWLLVQRLTTLACGLAYFVGFAPPTWLRRAWQEPELRAFLAHSGQLVREPRLQDVVRQLEDATAATFGATASLGLWREDRAVLRFFPRGDLAARSELGQVTPGVRTSRSDSAAGFELPPGRMIAGKAFAQQQALSTMNAARDDPEHAAYYRALRSQAVLAAPISVGARRFGVLVVYTGRAPVFAQSDLEVLQLLADLAGVVLENRLLVEVAAESRAREEANRQKDEFLSAMSHDLRNPLAAVQGVAQLLQRRLERRRQIEPERLASAVASILGATAQMGGLIDQLLDFARLQMDRPLDLDRYPTDLVALAREAVATYAGASERHHLRLEATAATVVGEWDTARLVRVLQNLLSNALKYSPEGGDVVVRVGVEQIERATWAVVAVQDQGLGIPAVDLPHVFERFHRAANVAGRIPGTGIGLAATRQIVEQHGGTITATSSEDGGSTFTVRLPLHQSEPPSAGDPPSGSTAAGEVHHDGLSGRTRNEFAWEGAAA